MIVTNLPRFEAFLNEIEGYYTIDEPKVAVQDGPFTGRNFVFTGFRDKNAQARIEALGGAVSDVVNKNTDYVVTKDPNSSSTKIQKAKNLGVKVIGPHELSMLLK
jgi:DNA ligase (NAD+)